MSGSGYHTVLAVFLLGVFAIWRIVHSPFGMILRSIRENEPRAISLGTSVARYKLAAFVMSAALAGLAGGLNASSSSAAASSARPTPVQTIALDLRSHSAYMTTYMVRSHR